MHQLKPAVDVGQRAFVRNEVINIDFAVHIPVDNFWHIATALGAAESRILSDTPGHPLKRRRFDFLPGANDTDDHRHHVKANTAQAKHHNISPRLDLRRVDHHTDAGGTAALTFISAPS